MLHHFATETANGPCVAYWQGEGVAVVVCECTTDDQAVKEAARLNFEARARAALAVRADRQFATPRRGVRYFENDAFA